MRRLVGSLHTLLTRYNEHYGLVVEGAGSVLAAVAAAVCGCEAKPQAVSDAMTQQLGTIFL